MTVAGLAAASLVLVAGYASGDGRAAQQPIAPHTLALQATQLLECREEARGTSIPDYVVSDGTGLRASRSEAIRTYLGERPGGHRGFRLHARRDSSALYVRRAPDARIVQVLTLIVADAGWRVASFNFCSQRLPA